MPLTVAEARELGAAKLNIGPDLFAKSREMAKRMEARPQDEGPLTLALAILGVAKAHTSDRGMQAELTDALALVAKAEQEWTMERELRERGH